jgi:hypothetical protein
MKVVKITEDNTTTKLLNQNRMQIKNPTRLVLAWKAMAYTLKFN